MLLTLLAIAPPQAQGRIRVDRLYGLNSDCTGASRYDYDGVLTATKNGNDYIYTINTTKQKKDQPLLSSSNFVNISEIRFRPTQAFSSLNGIEMTDDEAALFGTDAKPIIISVNTNYRLNYDNYYASYAEATSGTRGLTVNSSNGLFLQQNVYITFKTSDPKYRIHQIFFDAEGFTNISNASYKGFPNIRTMFKPYGTSANAGRWLTNADTDGIHPDPNQNGAKLTANQRLYSVTDPEGTESVEFWTDRLASGTSENYWKTQAWMPPAARLGFSSKVNITAELNEEGKPVVTIVPADNTLAPGSYKIYYTTEEGIVLTPENGIEYTGKFTMDKSGLVTAILVENGKPAGEPCYLNVWAGITGIDSIDGTDTTGSVRVDGNDIIAPEGSEVYDLSGRRVNPNGLAGGIYIVRPPDGKAIKVRI